MSIFRKLLSEKGESIAEVLMAGLVIALGSLLLFTMVNVSDNLITKEKESYAEFIETKNEFEMNKFTEVAKAEGGNYQLQIALQGAGNYTEDVKVYTKSYNDINFYSYEVIK